MAYNHRLKLLASSSLAGLMLLGSTAHAQEQSYQPTLDLVFKPGNERIIGYTDVMMPLLQNPDNMFYTNLRFMLDSDEAREGNFGLGYRRVIDNDMIAGTYAYLDRRRSQTENYFTQSTVGAELLLKDYEFRANGYIPLSDTKTVNGDVSLGFSGTTVTFDNGTALEEGLAGFDLEGGFKIPDLTWDTRVFAGYYHFSGDQTNVDIDGARVRFYTEPREWLRVGGEIQHDDVRDTAYYAEIRFRIPFGGFSSGSSHSGIQARMMEPVVRDVDIVTQAKDNSQPAPIGVAGTANEKVDVIVVDNTAPTGGNGTFERPYNTLSAGQSAAGVGDTIYLRTGSGTGGGQASGVSLSQDKIRLVGEGAALTLDAAFLNLDQTSANRAAAKVIRPAGTAPTITNASGAGVTISGNSVTVAGLNVTNAGESGIWVNNANDFKIANNTVSNAGVDGIQVTINSGTSGGSITNNVVNNGGSDNIEVVVNGGQLGSSASPLRVANNTLNSAENTGFYSLTRNSGQLFVELEKNTIRNAENFHGIDFHMLNSANVTATLLSNVVTNSSQAGIFFLAASGSTGTLNAKLQSNTSTSNGIGSGTNKNGLVLDKVSAGSTMTVDLGGGALGSTGGNRIFGNVGPEVDLDIDGGTLAARNNWWGVSTGLTSGEINSRASSSVDASNFLTADPGLPF